MESLEVHRAEWGGSGVGGRTLKTAMGEFDAQAGGWTDEPVVEYSFWSGER